MTTPDRYERVKEILLRVADLPEAERQAALDQACGDDRGLRAEVEGLLAHDRGPASVPSAASSPSSGSAPSNAGATIAIPPSDRFTPGQILGRRYRIVRLLGRGGMGEVWQAYDLKLQVDVALKSIRPERFEGEQGLELLRREVRSAREVMSPNVCRIFDLVEEEGQEFVSMEYIDGETLLDILLERGPLDLSEATRIASQFLSGLEAIHQAGLVHRDVKPENIMVTRTGRVVLMDFGIAKGLTEDRRGTIAGTPAYMAPEQLRGESLDARADIFAAGVVLAEMGAPEGIRAPTSRESIWRSVRQTPVGLGESPWRGVLERAVRSEPSGRYESARELARALEEVALRVEGAEDKHPYPGLNAFTAADAEFFFGREVEVEAVWKKLQRSNLLAIIGPSGAGKTSFLQAGLIPAEPAGWRHIICRPGSSPFVALARALAPAVATDKEAIDALLQIEDPTQAIAVLSRWRQTCGEALLVIDQFEELFTLCRLEVQASFAQLLGSLVAEADVHVLLVMRDDFLIRCHAYPGLAPLFSELTPLGPPGGSSLRRALVQPALLCGYRFEDESLADEMIGAIEGERGALPMLAFAAARLWEHRDRERGLLTREAYERIGGVSGALAQHAEATLARIGADRQAIVREIFRNLVTAQGTRAVADHDELLSVFPDRGAAEEVLHELIDARLVTSFEMPATREGAVAQRRVEIVHESLLSSWPRLVRWQTQDTEGAQFRDQLRQAAQLWKERHEFEDLLWTGTAFKEFELWRERYPGGLTVTEEAFAKAMVGKAGRQKRRRRRIIAGTIAALALVAAAMTAFGIRAQVAQRRSEANRLLALGRNEIDRDPTAALAYAIKSLAISDSRSAREFALEARGRGPTAHVLPLGPPFHASYLNFSRDGTRLAAAGVGGVRILFRDGSAPLDMEGSAEGDPYCFREPQFSPDGDQVVFTSKADRRSVRVWSIPERKETRNFRFEGATLPVARGERLYFVTDATGTTAGFGSLLPEHVWGAEQPDWRQVVLRAWSFDQAAPEPVGRWNLKDVTSFDIDPQERFVAFTKGRKVFLCPIENLDAAVAREVGEHANRARWVIFDAGGDRLASADSTGGICLWSLKETSPALLRTMSAGEPIGRLAFDPSGTRLVAMCHIDILPRIHVWKIDGFPDEDPLVLLRRSMTMFPAIAFDPVSGCLASAHTNEIDFWPLDAATRHVFRTQGKPAQLLAFTPDGRSLVTVTKYGGIRVFDLEGRSMREVRAPGHLVMSWMTLDPRGSFAALATVDQGVLLVNLSDGRERRLPDPSIANLGMIDVDISPDSRLVVADAVQKDGIRVWDLEADTCRILEGSAGKDLWDLALSGDGRVFCGDLSGDIWGWNLSGGACALVARLGAPVINYVLVSRDKRYLYAEGQTGDYADNTGRSELIRFDLEHGVSQLIVTHGSRLGAVALDATGELLATGDMDAIVRVGPASGEEPHLLFGQTPFQHVAIDPNRRWIAAAAATDMSVALWPFPEGRPLQTLPRSEFLERLRAWTNLRVTADPTSSTGYRLAQEPFTDWEKMRVR